MSLVLTVFMGSCRCCGCLKVGGISLMSVSIYTATASAFVQAMVELTCDYHLSSSTAFPSFLMASVVAFACDVGSRNLLGSRGCLRTCGWHCGPEPKPVSLAAALSSGDSRPQINSLLM